MKKTSFCLAVCGCAVMASAAHGGYDDRQFRREVLQGLDIVGAQRNADVIADPAPGALGLEVYQVYNETPSDDTAMFVETSMYLRGGAGLNLGFASDRGRVGKNEYESSGSWMSQIGLGWNLSSYVRTEIDFQAATFEFSDLDDYRATSQQVGGTLYFDFARRFVRTGDITRRRTFVPFMGLGVGTGLYKFEGAGGSDGFFVAPRAILGVNLMLTDVIGIDLSWQYQMFIGNGFGWDVRRGGVDNLNNAMVSFRVNF